MSFNKILRKKMVVAVILGFLLSVCCTFQAEANGGDGDWSRQVPLSSSLQNTVKEASQLFGVSEQLILAVIEVESSYNPDAYSEGCYGLMQINEINMPWLESELSTYGVTSIKENPADNIKAGAFLIGLYIRRYGDLHKALMAYNCGEYGAQDLWDAGYESSRYSRKVQQVMIDRNWQT